ncbi:MAG: hypothetical protein VXW25_09350, partial [Pseudomonadota bacterium]|nr:hypothetical protein [Pseudomonadota bacterium]
VRARKLQDKSSAQVAPTTARHMAIAKVNLNKTAPTARPKAARRRELRRLELLQRGFKPGLGFGNARHGYSP